MNVDRLDNIQGLFVKSLELAAGDQLLAQNLDFVLTPGQSLRLIGPNGAGKSTLLAVLAGLAPYKVGQIEYGAENLASFTPARLSQQVSLLKQIQFFTYPYSVGEIFDSHSQGLHNEIANRLRVPELAQKRVPQLSGGEIQRVFLSLTLLRNTWLTLLDEPLANQDDEMEEIIEALLPELMTSGRSFLVATHGGFKGIPTISLG